MDWFSKKQYGKLQGIHVRKNLIPRIQRWFGPNKLSQLYFLKFLRIMRQVNQKIPKWWIHHELLAEYVWMEALGTMFKNATGNNYCIGKEYHAIEYSGRCLVQYYEKWTALLKVKVTRAKSFRKSVKNILILAEEMKTVYAASCNERINGRICDFHCFTVNQIEILRDNSDDNLISEKQEVSYKRLEVVTLYKWKY